MKKNFLYSLTALFVMLFASCSQEEIVSTADAGMGDNKVRLSVNLSDEDFYSRASQSLDVEGYVMRCICQAVDANGALIDGFNQITSVTNGTASFEFEAPAGVANYLFWADYVAGTDIEATKSALYNATSLLEVKYNGNKKAALFNNPAADAFCAVASAANIGGSITLKRPFSRIAIKASDLAQLGLTGLDIITPNINAAQGYSVLNKTTSAAVTYSLGTDETLNVATGDLAFYCYVFPVNNTVTKNTSIKFTSASDETGKTIQLTAAEMQELSSSPNNAIYLRPDEDQPVQPGDETVKVEIVIDNSYTGEGGSEEPGTDSNPEEPVATEWAVGDYVSAAGTKVETAGEAIAVVFALGAQGGNAADYGTDYASKTIKAYAVALTNGARGVFGISKEDTTPFPTLTQNGDFTSWNGFTNTASLETMIGDYASQAFANYDTWVEANQLTGENLSPWYIPSFKQLETFCGLTFGDNADTNFAAKLKDSFATGKSNWFYISSTVREDGNFAAATINQSEGTCKTGGAEPQLTTSACIRAVVTIFE